MFEIPGFDPKTLSDDELLKKQEEIQRKLVIAARWSYAYEIITQLQNMEFVINNERRERMFNDVWKIYQNNFPDVLELDPNAEQQQAAEKESKKAPKTKQRSAREKFITKRTQVPVKPSTDE